MRSRDIPAHIKAVRYLKGFVDQRAPTNTEIAREAGIAHGSISTVLTRAIEGGFFAIERQSGMRRFVFADGSKTKWTQKNSGSVKPYVTRPKREEFTDAQAVAAIREHWKSRGFENIDVKVVGDGVVRASLNEFGWPA